MRNVRLGLALVMALSWVILAPRPAAAVDCLVDARSPNKTGDHVVTASVAITCNQTLTVIVGEAELYRNGLLVDIREFSNTNDRQAQSWVASICFGTGEAFNNVLTGSWANYPTAQSGSGSDSAGSVHNCELRNLIVSPCPPVCLPADDADEE